MYYVKTIPHAADWHFTEYKKAGNLPARLALFLQYNDLLYLI